MICEHDHHSKTTSAIAISLVLNLVFFFVELFVGLFSGSLALLSDAMHMLSDVFSLVVALTFHLLSSKLEKFGYSSSWIKSCGALLNSVTLIIAAIYILYEAAARFMSGAALVTGGPVLIVGLIGLLVNIASFLILSKNSNGDLNVEGAAAHMWADILGSVGAIISSLFIIAGFPIADIIIAIGISAMILFSASKLLYRVMSEICNERRMS